VRESNRSAMQFYQSLGFRNSGRRTGYYRHPQEAAVCLWKKIRAGTKSSLDAAQQRS
jgi:ribosomal protein S18 acetylase RimI-like enzyme